MIARSKIESDMMVSFSETLARLDLADNYFSCMMVGFGNGVPCWYVLDTDNLTAFSPVTFSYVPPTPVQFITSTITITDVDEKTVVDFVPDNL